MPAAGTLILNHTPAGRTISAHLPPPILSNATLVHRPQVHPDCVVSVGQTQSLPASEQAPHQVQQQTAQIVVSSNAGNGKHCENSTRKIYSVCLNWEMAITIDTA